MGMAASQARFLGLTARKSNVEYQGQQINQQRTALSNESANLYNEMMQLNVPTPPATSDFYSTSYVLTGSSSDDYAKSDYKLGTVVKTYEHQNEYRVTLITDREYYQRVNQQYKIGMVSQKPAENGEGTIYTIPLSSSATGRNTNLTFDTKKSNVYTEDGVNLQKAGGATPNVIYAVGANAEDLGGLKECYPELFGEDGKVIQEKLYNEEANELTGKANYFFYRDNNGENKFITADQLAGLLNGKEGFEEEDYFAVAVANEYTKEETIQVIANLETSDSTGRYATIQIAENSDYPVNLQGKIFTLDAVQEYDQKGYDDAYNDYEYQKGIYEKSISDINAKTEVIQNEDQQLELRLQQLNTEQSAIATEMDSVSKVIDDNIEKTFKVFA